MPKYEARCTVCKNVFDYYSTIAKRNKPPKCSCGKKAKRDVESELSKSGNFNELNKDRERLSNSLGIYPSQLEEANKVHPGAEWVKKGRRLCMKIKNRTEKLQRMKERGFCEYPANLFNQREGD